MKEYTKRFKDRRDAKRIDSIPGLSQISIDLKPNRSVSDVYINQKIDVTNLVEYVDKKKKQNSSITFFHAFVTALGKTIYNRPKLNRFVSDRHIYEHDEIVISFVAKIEFSDSSEEVMVLLHVDENDNIDSISKKIVDKLDSIRNKKAAKKGANNAIDVLGKLPNIIRVPLMGILKFMDRKGILPQEFTNDNIYYSSIIVSNLGSIKCGAIFHNINDFGTCSSLATIGMIKDEEVIIDGKKKIRKMCEFGINLDERIADGYYFAKSIRLFQDILDDPKSLEDKIDAKIKDSEIR